MTSLNYSKLRDKCCYCFQTEEIQVCRCLLTFCKEHLNLHKSKIDCSLLFYVDENGCVSGEGLTGEEIEKIQKRIEIIKKCENYEEKVVMKDGEVECPHIITERERIHLGKDVKCSDCPIDKHLYVCISCGFVGCGRLQYGIEGNGHAMEHFKATGHSVSILIQSITPEYACDTFCYTCNDFVVNPFCDKLLECEEFAEPGVSLYDTPSSGEPVSEPSPFIGLKNAGNTCYVSSVLQLYGIIVSKKNVDLNIHFDLCEYANPLHCFYCQTARILNEMKSQSSTHSTSTHSILDFLKLLWMELPMFTKNMQHDANEFLMMFTQKIKDAEDLGLFPPLTKYFTFEVENSIRCDSCKKNICRKEIHNMIISPFSHHVQDSLQAYFSDCHADCSCGGRMRIQNSILSLPDFFVVTIGRIVYRDTGFYKVTDSVGVDHVDLSNFIRKAKLSQFFISELQSQGFTPASINLAISTKFEDLEKQIEDYSRTNRVDPVYNILGSIIHSGNSMDSGHYMFWVRKNGSFYLINDRRVTEDTVDNLERSYIMIFE
ncbi:Ubiquitin carboxyl-terminal hydrolase 14 [Nosema granulosis]|uniref:Ubiquitin carboxyl-terminal hydrolase 14 n=1 Tax=Nosema granulosis TaxID=83296 RepID=A0A9P6GW16_9MICR|nr:Ubiquitin carboxyl-terminal hydrolase 14 [Nosema granulosis]